MRAVYLVQSTDQSGQTHILGVHATDQAAVDAANEVSGTRLPLSDWTLHTQPAGGRMVWTARDPVDGWDFAITRLYLEG